MVARAVTAPLVIGLDVGATKILSGLVDREGNVVAEHRVATPGRSQEDALAAMDAAVEEILDDRVAAIGYGIPANLERGTSRILRATNMLLAGIDLVGRSRERFGLPVGVENDGNVAALAEWKRGAGRDAANLVMLTLGTGVGGGIVLDDRLFRGWAELGHVVVQENGPPCPCGGRGHLEALASGLAADGIARGLYGPDADARVLVERARAGETAALEALNRIGASLGAAIGSLVNTFDPELVVIGGGFGMDAGELVLAPAREAARREAIPPGDEGLRIVPAELGAEAGLVGAGLVAFEALDGVR
jgi:glucokinase